MPPSDDGAECHHPQRGGCRLLRGPRCRRSAAQAPRGGLPGRLFGLFRRCRRSCTGSGIQPFLAARCRWRPRPGGGAMTISAADAALYAVALLVLFLTPGPVWLAMLARALSGGFRAAWPLALGVVVGDVLWPFLAILGVTWIVTVFSGFLAVLKWVAAATFVGMGLLIWSNADVDLSADSRLTRPGMWAGFLAGLAVILGNPKAVLFYMGVLPGFFDLTTVTVPDMVAIC